VTDRAVVHLEIAEDVMLVHGRLEDLGRPQDAGSALRAFDAKYDEPGDRQHLPSADPSFDVLCRLQPARALRWPLCRPRRIANDVGRGRDDLRGRPLDSWST
jgi:hypothetical protein